MKVRSLLTAVEVRQMHTFLERRLEAVGIESRPEVVVRLLDLATNQDAQLVDFARIIKADSAISGRVLKLANSALFAQRTPVTTLERACLILGLERLKSISLGFYLSRAATAKGVQEISRRIWGQSLLRACMAAEAARLTAPNVVAEAFVVGLMMDAGIPLMCRLAGDQYQRFFDDDPGPAKLFRREFDLLTFTHVDVITVVGKMWKLPELLAKPLELHHTKPVENGKDDPLSRLHRIAYCAGAPALSSWKEDQPAVTAEDSSAQRLLGIDDEQMGVLVSRSVSEYQMLMEVFSGIALPLGDFESLMSCVQRSLARAVDMSVEASLARESSGDSTKLVISGQAIELVREDDGGVVAFVTDSKGQRLASHRVVPGTDTPVSICDSLGIETSSQDDFSQFTERLRRFAA
jgi:HD-like signal output (HDOD) protein